MKALAYQFGEYLRERDGGTTAGSASQPVAPTSNPAGGSGLTIAPPPIHRPRPDILVHPPALPGGTLIAKPSGSCSTCSHSGQQYDPAAGRFGDGTVKGVTLVATPPSATGASSAARADVQTLGTAPDPRAALAALNPTVIMLGGLLLLLLLARGRS